MKNKAIFFLIFVSSNLGASTLPFDIGLCNASMCRRMDVENNLSTAATTALLLQCFAFPVISGEDLLKKQNSVKYLVDEVFTRSNSHALVVYENKKFLLKQLRPKNKDIRKKGRLQQPKK